MNVIVKECLPRTFYSLVEKVNLPLSLFRTHGGTSNVVEGSQPPNVEMRQLSVDILRMRDQRR